jgi:hypothetical protein
LFFCRNKNTSNTTEFVRVAVLQVVLTGLKLSGQLGLVPSQNRSFSHGPDALAHIVDDPKYEIGHVDAVPEQKAGFSQGPRDGWQTCEDGLKFDGQVDDDPEQ